MASRMEDQDNVGRSAVLWIECDDGKLKIIRKILSFLRKAWTVPNVEDGTDLGDARVRFPGVKTMDVRTAILLLTTKQAIVSKIDIGNVFSAMNFLGFEGLTYTSRATRERDGMMELLLNDIDHPTLSSFDQSRNISIEVSRLEQTENAPHDTRNADTLPNPDTSDILELRFDRFDDTNKIHETPENQNGRKKGNILHITLDSDGEEEDVEIEVTLDSSTKGGFLGELGLISRPSLFICETCGETLTSEESFSTHMEAHAKPLLPATDVEPFQPSQLPTNIETQWKCSTAGSSVPKKKFERYKRYTPEDDRRILKCMQKLGTCWESIAKYFPGRKCTSVAGRYYYLLRCQQDLEKHAVTGRKVKSFQPLPSRFKKQIPKATFQPTGRRRPNTQDEADKVNPQASTSGPPVQMGSATEKRQGIGRIKTSARTGGRVARPKRELQVRRRQNGRLTSRSNSHNKLNWVRGKCSWKSG